MNEASSACTPWDIQVDQLVKTAGVSVSMARDTVIFDWLTQGDTNPYTDLVVERGHMPGREVVRYVGMMMNPAKETEKEIPFGLKISQRGRRGARHYPGNAVRDYLVYENMKSLMGSGTHYDDALDKINDMFESERRDTIEKAYQRENRKR